MFQNNVPDVKLGIVAVSRDCFPRELSESRRKAVVATYQERGKSIHECPVIVENECDAVNAAADLAANDVNALVVYLGNFGPETPETILAQKFGGPVMYIAAAEETQENLIDGRGDAYCGMLNASYNLGIRNIKAYIPEYPVGTASDVCDMMDDFIPVARTILGLSNLKIIAFGPRPNDFLACNAPIKKLFDLGVEVEENSELDLLVAVKEHENDPRIPDVVADMEKELGAGNKMPTLLPKLAQFELTLLDWAEAHKGSRKYVAFANKCWPAFQTQFGFCPCYVNSRLTGRGIPVSCEVDIYGALSEYIGLCASGDIVTLLDINNSVPADMYLESIKDKYNYNHKDTFMGFHCGNTNAGKLAEYEMKYQLIQHRCLEPDKEPDVSRGTLEGAIQPGPITFFRLQGTAEGGLKSYVAEGEVLPVNPRSFGGIGVFAIPEMGRFYRHVLIAKRYPHHGAVAFGHFGKAIFDIMKYLGVEDVAFNQPKGMMYPTENPFEK
ncbi:L-fucose isomerase and related proteins [uncultured Ruminococcus sp.]|uniref:Fucose isomerase n=1 Tax=Massiliimalia timonensis TaxID=1987501 RepID=A0A8J6TR01_9FIRM|nr:L-fucose/L-arabinose isomerase family protein [Massiliimalia timonensis]MBC8611739.1 fucose isomerase [Massiliimalia timonensis]SCH60848.1 L-fucose isomerase and related proteins [uncultured Clostridium sp.]SCH74785.1 L-fucose isomerase and related proteins [uncultured Ruminococcus sp.]